MKLLAVDSSSRAASVALVSDGAVIGEFFVNNFTPKCERQEISCKHIAQML